MRELVQEIVGTLLVFVLFFGIGFILNMLIKTTWLPTWLYVLIVLPLSVWYFWDPELSVLAFFGVFTLPLLAGIGGALVSGWAIRALRRGGYRMF
ncbi:YuiB family protein [Cohnella sp. REN36]|uniref:YuiB family protein n=1 Tax=Cohnella sp. REN36 TaxID=2887347 RepID=UPI001D15DDE4|nr:YuiB family protein [Cohnella sp. REN36]MCC3374622.1 YuiB family protein [Cohnella sp. REN36]